MTERPDLIAMLRREETTFSDVADILWQRPAPRQQPKGASQQPDTPEDQPTKFAFPKDDVGRRFDPLIGFL